MSKYREVQIGRLGIGLETYGPYIDREEVGDTLILIAKAVVTYALIVGIPLLIVSLFQ